MYDLLIPTSSSRPPSGSSADWKGLDNEQNGTFVKLPSGYGGELSTSAPVMRVVTIQGQASIQLSGESDTHSLAPGSYFGSKGEAAHQLSCDSDEECILYFHTEGKYQLGASP